MKAPRVRVNISGAFELPEGLSCPGFGGCVAAGTLARCLCSPAWEWVPCLSPGRGSGFCSCGLCHSGTLLPWSLRPLAAHLCVGLLFCAYPARPPIPHPKKIRENYPEGLGTAGTVVSPRGSAAVGGLPGIVSLTLPP